MQPRKGSRRMRGSYAEEDVCRVWASTTAAKVAVTRRNSWRRELELLEGVGFNPAGRPGQIMPVEPS